MAPSALPSFDFRAHCPKGFAMECLTSRRPSNQEMGSVHDVSGEETVSHSLPIAPTSGTPLSASKPGSNHSLHVHHSGLLLSEGLHLMILSEMRSDLDARHW